MSVLPEWMESLPYQQQSVLLLAGRGPDGVGKFHGTKDVHRAYRACVFKAAYYGRELRYGEKADTFMSLDLFANDKEWQMAVRNYFNLIDELPHHYHMHFMHGAEILGYKHPDLQIRLRWQTFYVRCCEDLHLRPETEGEMNRRLCDWDRLYWDSNTIVMAIVGHGT